MDHRHAIMQLLKSEPADRASTPKRVSTGAMKRTLRFARTATRTSPTGEPRGRESKGDGEDVVTVHPGIRAASLVGGSGRVWCPAAWCGPALVL
jgi:hypothetical protein